mmetsp:Transcript_45307/g.117293  ORF Transcript_45307/g.117293 Transcript_45307/m.117293 type:complete len:227 (-) Transcript_45307:1061-1741(-)
MTRRRTRLMRPWTLYSATWPSARWRSPRREAARWSPAWAVPLGRRRTSRALAPWRHAPSARMESTRRFSALPAMTFPRSRNRAWRQRATCTLPWAWSARRFRPPRWPQTWMTVTTRATGRWRSGSRTSMSSSRTTSSPPTNGCLTMSAACWMTALRSVRRRRWQARKRAFLRRAPSLPARTAPSRAFCVPAASRRLPLPRRSRATPSRLRRRTALRRGPPRWTGRR